MSTISREQLLANVADFLAKVGGDPQTELGHEDPFEPTEVAITCPPPAPMLRPPRPTRPLSFLPPGPPGALVTAPPTPQQRVISFLPLKQQLANGTAQSHAVGSELGASRTYTSSDFIDIPDPPSAPKRNNHDSQETNEEREILFDWNCDISSRSHDDAPAHSGADHASKRASRSRHEEEADEHVAALRLPKRPRICGYEPERSGTSSRLRPSSRKSDHRDSARYTDEDLELLYGVETSLLGRLVRKNLLTMNARRRPDKAIERLNLRVFASEPAPVVGSHRRLVRVSLSFLDTRFHGDGMDAGAARLAAHLHLLLRIVGGHVHVPDPAKLVLTDAFRQAGVRPPKYLLEYMGKEYWEDQEPSANGVRDEYCNGNASAGLSSHSTSRKGSESPSNLSTRLSVYGYEGPPEGTTYWSNDIFRSYEKEWAEIKTWEGPFSAKDMADGNLGPLVYFGLRLKSEVIQVDPWFRVEVEAGKFRGFGDGKTEDLALRTARLHALLHSVRTRPSRWGCGPILRNEPPKEIPPKPPGVAPPQAPNPAAPLPAAKGRMDHLWTLGRVAVSLDLPRLFSSAWYQQWRTDARGMIEDYYETVKRSRGSKVSITQYTREQFGCVATVKLDEGLTFHGNGLTPKDALMAAAAHFYLRTST